jgi:hypothetical protein
MTVYNWLGLRPKMIEIHHYKVLDSVAGKWVVPPMKCSAARIAELKGEIIAGTMDVVARASLDQDGSYDPKQAGKDSV